MVSKIPQPFLESTGDFVQSYNYFDVAEGTGVQAFYGVKLAYATTPLFDYIFTGNSSVWSDDGGRTSNFNDSFDITFNLPKQIRGIVYLNLPLSVNHVSSATATADVTLKKVSGGAEETIGATQRTNSVFNGGTGTNSAMVTMMWDVAETSFKAGDSLRLTITTNTSAGTATIGHSPVGTQSTGTGLAFNAIGTSRMTLFVPFVLDI